MEHDLMRVGVVGINHKLADLRLRELLAKACQRRFGIGRCIHGQHHFILLSTCNRTEVYFSSDDLAQTHTYLLKILRDEVLEDFDQKLYSYFGHDCFLHLSRVVSGLDSAIIAETEIQGQVKATYENSIEYFKLPNEMHYMFQKSLKIGKEVRSEFPIRRGLPNLEHAILNTGNDLFKSLQQIQILFVGASDINCKILAFFKNKKIENITLCNRSPEHIHEIVQQYQVKAIEWQNLSKWPQYDWIIFGTKAPNYLANQDCLPKNIMSQKLIIDLSVPRNVSPDLARHPQITLLNIDQINRMLNIHTKTIRHTVIKAEQLVASSARKQVEIFLEKEKNKHRFIAVG